MPATTRSQMSRALSLGTKVSALLFLAGSCHGGRVVIIEGTDARPEVKDGIHKIATVAHINYLAKGYTVERLSNADGPVTKTAVLQALNNPVNNAVFFCGHGTQTPPDGPFVPGLVLNDGPAGVLVPADIPAPVAALMRHVEFQACGQKLPAWDAKFPNAAVDAWSRSVTVAQAWNDARYRSPARIPHKNPSLGTEDDTPRGLPPKLTDARFEAAIRATPFFMSNPPVAELFDAWIELGFTLPPPLASAMGTRSFNVVTSDGMSVLPLKGLTVTGGAITGEVSDGYVIADFTMVIDADAFAAAMENLDAIPALRSAGKFGITSNTTPLPPNVLLDAAIGAYFGTFVLTPPCPGDINGDGHTNTADLTILLGNFGTSVTMGTGGDLNYDGTVNTADLTMLLGGFGC